MNETVVVYQLQTHTGEKLKDVYGKRTKIEILLQTKITENIISIMKITTIMHFSAFVSP